MKGYSLNHIAVNEGSTEREEKILRWRRSPQGLLPLGARIVYSIEAACGDCFSRNVGRARAFRARSPLGGEQ